MLIRTENLTAQQMQYLIDGGATYLPGGGLLTNDIYTERIPFPVDDGTERGDMGWFDTIGDILGVVSRGTDIVTRLRGTPTIESIETLPTSPGTVVGGLPFLPLTGGQVQAIPLIARTAAGAAGFLSSLIQIGAATLPAGMTVGRALTAARNLLMMAGPAAAAGWLATELMIQSTADQAGVLVEARSRGRGKRMNPLNPRALRRAMSRVVRFDKFATTSHKMLARYARKGRR